MIRVIVVDDHLGLLDGIKEYFKYYEDIQIMHTFTNGNELLNRLKEGYFDVLVTDIQMPMLNGVYLAKKVLEDFPEAKILTYTMHANPESFRQMIMTGVHGYVLKTSSLETLYLGIKAISSGDPFFDKDIPFDVTNRNKEKGTLSKREWQILWLIADGLNNQQIADRLFISRRTVETHRKNMRFKLRLTSSSQSLVEYSINLRYNG